MDLQNFADAEQALAATLPGYSHRPHQEALATAIEQAVRDKRIILAQGPCGTGKSLAGLIPAIIQAKRLGQRVMVGTATKTLQSQYMGDLTFLQENLFPELKWAIVKGRSNYPCAAKIAQLDSPTYAQRKVLDVLGAAGPDEVLDKETLPRTSEGEWAAMSMSASECPGARHCPFAKRGECVAEQVKERAATSDVVITNLTYLMLDRVIDDKTEGKVNLLGDYQLLVVDEAHNLADAATDALSDNLGSGQIRKLADDAEGFLHDQAREDSDVAWMVKDPAAGLWNQMERLFAQRNEGNREESPVRLSKRDRLGFGEAVVALTQALVDVRELVLAVRYLDKNDPAYTMRQRILNRLDNLYSRLSAVLTAEGQVYWLEAKTITRRGVDERQLRLMSAPLSPAPFLREAVWARVPAVVMMSATLTTGRKNGQADFSFIRDQIGLADGEAMEFDAGTPFDFARQARIFIPETGTPEPVNGKQAAWQTWSQGATRDLVLAAGGNALLLFTSWRNLRAAHDQLAGQFTAAGLNVVKQGDAPTPELIAELKRGRTVLFGLKSFFEGVDVQGKALSLVVIDKLPFAVPTDVLVAARTDDLKAKYGEWAGFNRLTIPSMSLVLIQGAGRLIRTVSDYGVIAIMDPRLNSKGYGKKIRASLPAAPVTGDVREAAAFLQAHHAA